MAASLLLDLPLNRTEGDLEIRIEINGGTVVDAWSSGTLFRGFESMMIGRNALDGLVITPRICGICSTTHLMAAALALDAIAGVTVPANAERQRNLALVTEQIQSDLRQSILMFMPDFTAPAYAEHPLYDQVLRRYTPVQGSSCLETIRATRDSLELVALIGGQWPHSSFMVPGGVVRPFDVADLISGRHIVEKFRRWYERRILGCSLERWNHVRSVSDLEAWSDECRNHQESDLGFFLRLARDAGLDKVGRGVGRFLSFGGIDTPGLSSHLREPMRLFAAGYANANGIHPLDQSLIAEHTGHSWYEESGPNGLHPFCGETKPRASGDEGGRYSWAKAPRYDGHPTETGPLAEMVIGQHPLFVDLLREGAGPSAMVRQLARMVRPALMIPVLEGWLADVLADPEGSVYTTPPPIENGQGCGLIQAARGALGHWVSVEDGLISRYQIITPSAWNGSPRDNAGVRGPWEEALIGLELPDTESPVMVGHVVRSFDPCLVCTVHSLTAGHSLGRLRMRL